MKRLFIILCFRQLTTLKLIYPVSYISVNSNNHLLVNSSTRLLKNLLIH